MVFNKKLYKNKQNAPGCNTINIKVKLWYAARRYMNCTAAKYKSVRRANFFEEIFVPR